MPASAVYIRHLLRREAELRASKRATNLVDRDNAEKLRRLRLSAELSVRGLVETLNGPSLFEVAA